VGQRCCAQIVVGGSVLEAYGGDGGVDGAQLEEGKTRVWLTSSFSSSSEAERRLEDARVPVTFGLHWRTWFAAKKFKSRASRGASEQPKGNEAREGV
jgi:hypothetical protein